MTYQRLNRKKLLVGFVLRNVLELPIFFRSRADIVSKPTKKHAVIYESDFFGDLISSLPLIEYLSKEYDKITVITRDGLNAEFCKQYGVNVVGLDLPYKKDNFLAWWLKIYRSRIKISNIFDNCDVYETRGDLRNFLILSAIRYSTLFSFNLTIPRYKGVKLYQWPTNFSLWKTKCTLAQNVFKRDLNLADVQKIIRSSIISDNTKDQREATLNIFYHPGASQRHKRLTNKSSAELIEYLSKFGNVIVVQPPDLDLTELEKQLECKVEFRAYNLTEFIADIQQCSLYVGMDSGFTHLAAASGVRTVMVFWHSKYSDFLPYGNVTPVLGTKEASQSCLNGELVIQPSIVKFNTNG